VAPTKALVNDLYERLVAYLGIKHPGTIARYTGDRHEYSRAEGAFCVVVTPEALDSLQLRHPERLHSVRSVVVDEIHFTDEELRHLDKWVRSHTVDRYGPVRAVGQQLVLEIAFEGLQRSTRHKSGIAMRFPRISRIRWDKPAAEADVIETLEAMLPA